MLNAGRNNNASPIVIALVVLMILISSVAALGSLFIYRKEALVYKPYALVHPSLVLAGTKTPTPSGPITIPTTTRTLTPTPLKTSCCSNVCVNGSIGGTADQYCSTTRGTGFKCCNPAASTPTPRPFCPDGTGEYGCCPSNRRICRRNLAGTYACIGGTTDCTPFQLISTPTRTRTPTRIPTTMSQNMSCLDPSCRITSYRYSFFCEYRNRECKTTYTVKTCGSLSCVSPSTRCFTTYFGNCADSIECTTDAECNVQGRTGYRCVTFDIQPEFNNHCTNR